MPLPQQRDPTVGALSQAFRAAEGIPAPTAVPGAGGSLNELLAMMQGGKLPPEMLMALLSALTGFGPQGAQEMMGAGPQMPGGESAIAAAMLGG